VLVICQETKNESETSNLPLMFMITYAIETEKCDVSSMTHFTCLCYDCGGCCDCIVNL